MWWVWLVFYDCAFHLSALWRWRWLRGLWRLPDRRDWLWGNLGLFLMGQPTPSHILMASPQGYSQLKRFLSSKMAPLFPGHSHFRTGPCRGTGTPVWDRPAPALWAPAPGDAAVASLWLITAQRFLPPHPTSFGVTQVSIPRALLKKVHAGSIFISESAPGELSQWHPSKHTGVIFLPQLSGKRGRTGEVRPP